VPIRWSGGVPLIPSVAITPNGSSLRVRAAKGLDWRAAQLYDGGKRHPFSLPCGVDTAVEGSPTSPDDHTMVRFLVMSLAAAVASVAPYPVLAQPDLPEALTQLSQAVLEIRQRRPTLQPAEVDALQESVLAAQRLRQRWNEGGRPDLPEGYIQTLQLNAELLRGIAAGEDSLSPDKVLADVRDDLLLKERFAAVEFALVSRFRGAVSVRVVTRRGGQQADGFMVRANPRRWGVRSDPLFVFNNPSPSQRELPPGNYVIWAETPNGTMVASQPITVGDDNAERKEIILIIPE
jgi:hypothetical protein